MSKGKKKDKDIVIVYIGFWVYRNERVMRYIKRTQEPFIRDISQEIYIDSVSSDIPTIFQKFIDTKKTYIIYVDEVTFPLVTKILATINLDNISANQNGIYPTLSENSQKGYFKYKINNALFNVVEIEVFEKLPNIQLESENYGYLHIFTNKEHTEESLLKLSSFEDVCGCIAYTPTWFECLLSSPAPILPASFPEGKRVKSDNIFKSIVEYFKSKNKQITIAESCTGGLIASKITSVSGASSIIEGTFVTYSNRIKSEWLGVSKETLIKYGAVSKECVEEMARGAKKQSKADIAIAVSGIAGPTGAVEGKPVGTVFVSVLNGDDMEVVRLHLKGDRVSIQEQTLYRAIEMLIRSEEEFFDFF